MSKRNSFLLNEQILSKILNNISNSYLFNWKMFLHNITFHGKPSVCLPIHCDNGALSYRNKVSDQLFK